ncbi:hypothetical protein CVIRNUC_010442 [Coccomyxa viridis]|uniref:Uncharacterized protein n=1 Tax=Coccomyxa viridis TaxID=1274662 RepID=A0AAV1IK72_9CHLO|nr:hypothetical protein CVIRNUC_010442 [Coccomyxa viridis]
MGCASSRATVGRNGEDTVAGQYEVGAVGQSPQISDDTALPAPGKRHLAQRARRGSVSAEVKSFSATKVEALNLRKSLQTEDNLIGALRHCFLFQGRVRRGTTSMSSRAASLKL